MRLVVADLTRLGPTVSVSSQTFDDQSASEFLRNIQASMAIPSAPSTGDP